MSPMTKDRDIDDIIESLEELLSEADACGDSMVTLPALQQDSERPIAAGSPFHLLSTDVKNDDVEDHDHAVVSANDETNDALLSLRVVAETVSNQSMDETEMQFEDDVEIANDVLEPFESEEHDMLDIEQDETEISVPIMPMRVLLTEDMLEDNPQEHLALHMKEDIDCVKSTVPATAVEQGVLDQDLESAPQENQLLQLDAQAVEQLLEDISVDVATQLEQQLSDMISNIIKQSLHRHLTDLQNAGDTNLSEESDRDE